MAAPAEDLISSIFDEAAIKKQIADTNKELDDLATRLKTFPTLNIGGGAATLKELTAQNKAYADSLKGISASTKTVLDSEKLAAIERKRIADERTQQARLAVAELKLQQAEIKQKALIEKEAAATEKQAAKEAVEAGRERLQQLRAEKEAAEKLAAAEAQRSNDENQALAGTFNPGGGAGNNRPASAPLKLTVEERDIVKLKSYEAEVARLTKEIDLSKTAFKNGEIAQSSYIKTMVRNTIEIKNNKTNIADLTKEMKLAQAVNDAERNSLGRAQALIAQYTNAKKRLNLATAEGKLLNENYNKAIEKTNAFILKNADAETVRTKTIGKYENAIVSAGSRAFSFLRTAANIIPGLGISGIFLAIFEGIKIASEALGIFNSKLSDTAKNKLDLADIFTDAGKAAGQDIAVLEVLKSKIVDLSLPLSDRNTAIKEYNKIADEGNKIDLKNIDSTNALSSAIDRQISLIEKRAIAKAFENKIAEAAGKVVDEELKLRETNLGKEIDAINKKEDAQFKADAKAVAGKKVRVISEKEYEQALKEGSITQEQINANLLLSEKRRQDGIQLRQTAEFKSYTEAKNNLDRLLKLSKDYISVDSLVTKDPKPKKSSAQQAVKDSTKEIFDAEFEETKRALQRRIKLLEEAANDESKTYDERIQSLELFADQTDKLNRLQFSKDLENEQKRLQVLNANKNKAKGAEKSNLEIEIKNSEGKIKDLENKLYNDRLNLADVFAKKKRDIFLSEEAQEEADRQRAYEQELKDAEIKNNGIKNELNNQFISRLQAIKYNQDKGIISEKEANAKRDKLQFDYQVQAIRNELKFAKEILAIQKARGIDTVKQEQAIADLAFKLEETILKGSKDSNEKKLLSDEEYAKRKKDLYRQLYQELQQTIFQFLDDGLKREEQDLDERKRLLDEDTQRRINNINQLGLTEVERVKQTAAVEKNAQFQTEQIEKRKRAIQVERAKYEKAASIANIIRTTAEAVVAALKIGPPQGFVLAALTGAIGAFQLARAISTPLPKYFKGTDSAKAGPGIYGEIGRELVIPKSGQPYLSPGIPSITNFLGGEKIIPADITTQLLNMIGAGSKVTAPKNQTIPFSDLLTEQKRTTRAIEKMKLYINIKNSPAIESSGWFDKHFKN
jgi:hypothetical protein